MQSRIFSSLGIAIFPILFLSAPFIMFLKANNISLLADGLLLSLGLKLLIVYALSFVLIFLSGIFKGLLLSIALLFFIDYQVKFEEIYDILGAKSDFFDADRFYLLYGIAYILAFAIIFFVFIRLKNHHYKALLVIFGGIYVFIIFMPNTKQAEIFKDVLNPNLDRPKATHLPPVVNIILSGHGALDALNESLPAVKEAKEQILQFHEKHDLVLFSHALSQYAAPEDAIANVLNFSQDPRTRSYFEGQRKQLTLRHNNYFAYMNDKGYVFDIYQHKAMNFCTPNRAKIARCYTYNEEFPIQMVSSIQSSEARHDLIIDEFLRSSFFLKNIGKLLNIEFHHLISSKLSFAHSRKPLNYQSMNLLAELGKDVIEKGDSHVYFAHLNLPAEPFTLKKDCSLRPYNQGWYVSKKSNESEEVKNQKASYLAEQMQCVYKTLDALIESWKTKGIYEDIILTIQGDRGFALNGRKPAQELDSEKARLQDLDLFATHFSYHKTPLRFGSTNAIYLLSDMFSGIVKLHPFAEEKEPKVFVGNKEHPELLEKRPYLGKK
jgi:hypothetical protein